MEQTKLSLVTPELIEQARINREQEEQGFDIVTEVVGPNVEIVPNEVAAQEAIERDLENDRKRIEAVATDVLGMRREAIWLIAAEANVSRGKVRRVLRGFEPLFWSRLAEAYQAGQQEVLAQLEALQQNQEDPQTIENLSVEDLENLSVEELANAGDTSVIIPPV